MGPFLDYWLIWEGPGLSKRSSRASGREQASKQRSSSVPASVCLQVPPWTPALTDSLLWVPQWQRVSLKPNKPFPPPGWLWSVFYHHNRNQVAESQSVDSHPGWPGTPFQRRLAPNPSSCHVLQNLALSFIFSLRCLFSPPLLTSFFQPINTQMIKNMFLIFFPLHKLIITAFQRASMCFLCLLPLLLQPTMAYFHPVSAEISLIKVDATVNCKSKDLINSLSTDISASFDTNGPFLPLKCSNYNDQNTQWVPSLSFQSRPPCRVPDPCKGNQHYSYNLCSLHTSRSQMNWNTFTHTVILLLKSGPAITTLIQILLSTFKFPVGAEYCIRSSKCSCCLITWLPTEKYVFYPLLHLCGHIR